MSAAFSTVIPVRIILKDQRIIIGDRQTAFVFRISDSIFAVLVVLVCITFKL